MSEPYLSRWRLRRDGPAIRTPHARLWPVLTADDLPAMLKISSETEEQNSHRLLRWWDGDGAARLLAHEGPAILIERAGGQSLRERSIAGDDSSCTTILCQVLQRLHRPRSAPPAELVCLPTWFADLLQPRAALPPLLEQCRSLAVALLEDEQEVRPLHGDLHHDNVLDFGTRGWLAIDPKRLIGDRAFDYTTLFSNPDLCGPGIHVATRPERFAARVTEVSALADLDRTRLLRWIAASAGLSAVWFRNDGDPADIDETVAAMALEALAEG
ncbi:APH(6) family putative aminoglycoside O-phosphotransferase [Stenotrophomonas maltophilia]|uniref:APH(6) family putative aminoglycoside O-phosphotransferase n=1 Tax=Stenotrophomonas maltophilia TaxID=40324 RepID=UPI0020971F01|nr:APH(6) family putative aminoglycoside O-phosphotransferase [Stenotrophomonas maltophilia]MCO7397650.1 APH(6) family putative aminoglycoside O-phosphotransferase [Stenotrophomonas maltophilia]MCO7409843.1 APH(6) family putative aminoglycoside O-phosphotransferase [Stenotrophomonas maltophilia]HDS1649714.1 APH(6) family putative aminoglycoside O-phosphotransferase [Stenotrophomonas maltophilia]HDS1652122.1 APH(6) family putative aminoglycoside O-phosphotransferase [Stenotrophomonas maltophilia